MTMLPARIDTATTVGQVAQALGTFKQPGWLAGLLGSPVTPDTERATAS